MWVLIFILVFTGWSYGANQMRAQALSLRNRDFIESARVRGERSLYIILFEALPTMVSLILATFLNAALYSVITAAGLQFLGLGDPNSDSWGIMLHWAEQPGRAGDRHPVVGPGPGAGHRPARRVLRPDELRLRRDQQPGPAAGEEAACQQGPRTAGSAAAAPAPVDGE